MKIRLLLMCVVLCVVAPYSQAGDDDFRIKNLMHNLVFQYDKMGPYLSSDKTFNSAEGKAVISESLKELANRVKNPPPPNDHGPGFRISYNLLADYV
jgi:hypothetical protein